ncbi:cytochrome P450 4c3 [Trichonephila inaurata madagascariensis]|uniref:Cytochrome P450 4c3 n=1 Tax=Trichonephila inaurata madagascariensis TaxID=2747483 RepID=A0A8X7BU24_9ARAC|nr:cytochrome P450 4c3 [Trichonephila inaurata madagascariensis]
MTRSVFFSGRLGDMYMSRNMKVWEWSDFIFHLTSGREEKSLLKTVNEITDSVIQVKKKMYLSGNQDNSKIKRKSFMDLLLEHHFETQELSEEDIREEVNTFFAAGHETVALTLIWAMYLIGLNPDAQAKLYEEIERIFGKDRNRHVTESDLNDLKYLDCVIKETQRLFPTVPLIGRRLLEETNICGYTLPKGSNCIILIELLHKDKDVFPYPKKFDPDRFLPENLIKIPESAYIPFSAGPRNCIGQKFGLMEIKTIFSFILRNYTIESLDSRDNVLPIPQFSLHPSIPIRIRLRTR